MSTLTVGIDILMWIVEILCCVGKWQIKTLLFYLISVLNIFLVFNVYYVFQEAIDNNNTTPIRLLAWEA